MSNSTTERRHIGLSKHAQSRPRQPNGQYGDGVVSKPAYRSAVTNGRRMFVVKDHRGAWARRFRDIVAEVINDLGGADLLSEGQKQLVRRCATIAIACEKMEGEAAAGHDIDLETFGQLTDRLGRCFNRLGLKRQTRDVTPSLGDILREDQQRNGGRNAD